MYITHRIKDTVGACGSNATCTPRAERCNTHACGMGHTLPHNLQSPRPARYDTTRSRAGRAGRHGVQQCIPCLHGSGTVFALAHTRGSESESTRVHQQVKAARHPNRHDKTDAQMIHIHLVGAIRPLQTTSQGCVLAPAASAYGVHPGQQPQARPPVRGISSL